MRQFRPYIYDPSQQIRKDLGNTALSIEEGFQNVIDKKKEEYETINRVFQDVESLKKDLNVYNSELITNQSNDLVKQTASAIKEAGKIDYQKLGEIRRKVSDIADAKRNSNASIQALDNVIKMVQANAANMRNPIDTINNVMGLLKDPKNLFSPKNIHDTALLEYRKGVDYTKMIQNKLAEFTKRGTPVQGSFKNSSGALVQYSGVVPLGFKFDDATKRIVPDTSDGKDPIALIKNTIDPELWEGYMEQVVGFGKMFNDNKEDYATDLINSTLSGSISYKEDKSAEEMKKLEMDIAVKEQDLQQKAFENSPEQRALREEKIRADIEAKQASKGASLASTQNSLASARLSNIKADKELAEGSTPKPPPQGGIKLLGGGSQLPLSGKFNGKDYTNIVVNQKGGLSIVSGKKNVALTDAEAMSLRNSLKKEEMAAFDELTSDRRYKGKLKTTKSTFSMYNNIDL